MKRRITCLFMCAIMMCALVACGSDSNNSESKVDSTEEENVINEDILAVAKTDEQFNTEEIIERANNRMKTEPEFYSGSKVPKIDSCVTGVVYDEVKSKDGNYLYYFGEGEDAKDEKVYLSAVLAYSAHLKALGLKYELNKGKMSYIYDGSDAVASFMLFDTADEGFVMIITPN